MSEPALHQRITDDLAGEIRSGAWPPGYRIPFEHELTARYGCARATVNKAVQALAAAGLVDRRRRAGTFVARPRIQSAVLQIPDMEAEITRRGQTYGYELLSRRVRALGQTPEETDLGGDGAVLDLRCRHLAGGAPFAFEARVINLAAAPEALDADFSGTAPGAWLLAHAAWTEARHQITAINPDAETAAGLVIDRARACLCLKRWTWRPEAGVTYARQVFPGDVYDLVARFTPGAG
jgi:GntR family histidine utilization transcriptional repressor